MHKLILIVLLVTWSNLSQAQYSTEFVDVYKMDSNDKMQKMGTKKFPMDITINGKNIFMFDKTSDDKEVYDVEKRTEEKGLMMIHAISRRTKLPYKFTIIDKKVSVFYDYDTRTETFKSALMFHN
jgi:uncharacterized phage-like protein YoqJ